MTTVYLAGPMSGLPEYNFPAFHQAAAYLRDMGWTVINPAERDLKNGFDPKRGLAEQGFDRAEAMTWDLRQILDADGIVLLPGWEDSAGARLEFEAARQCEKAIFTYNPLIQKGARLAKLSATQGALAPVADTTVPPSDETVLEEAQRLIHGDRNADYGHPLDDFSCTARLWYAYLAHKYDELGHDMPPLEAEDVGLMMVLLKVSRQANTPKRDNLVDGCGYFGTVEMVIEERARRAA